MKVGGPERLASYMKIREQNKNCDPFENELIIIIKIIPRDKFFFVSFFSVASCKSRSISDMQRESKL
jgi:hypothetical protein